MNRTMFVKAIGMAALLAPLAPQSAYAGDVDITKNRDSRITVWKTLLGYRYGDPIYDGTLPAGHNLKISEGWLTDLSVQQDLLALGNHRTTTGMATVTGTPGTYTMPNLEAAVTALAGDSRIALPDFASSFFDVFVTIDLDDYVLGGGHAPPMGSSFFAINGQIPGMPGVSIGLAPFEFNSSTGWTTPSLFTGSLDVIGEMGLQTPAPGATTLLALGTLITLRRRR